MLHNCCWNTVPKENETVAELKLLIRSICQPIVRHI
jgi:hypothetical protein